MAQSRRESCSSWNAINSASSKALPVFGYLLLAKAAARPRELILICEKSATVVACPIPDMNFRP